MNTATRQGVRIHIGRGFAGASILPGLRGQYRHHVEADDSRGLGNQVKGEYRPVFLRPAQNDGQAMGDGRLEIGDKADSFGRLALGVAGTA
jgi:hypothetical protein